MNWIIVGLILLVILTVWIGGKIADRRNEQREKIRLSENQKKAKLLSEGETYWLSDKPLPASFRLKHIDIEEEWVRGTIVVTLPKGSRVINIQEKSNWERFTIVYENNNKWYTPTWQFGWRFPVLLNDFWKVECRGVEVEISKD